MKAAPALTTDPIRGLLWRIGIPSSVGMFFNTMYNFVDTYCAGLLSTDALAALSLSFPVFFVLLAVGSGLSQGTTALLGNCLGAGQRAEARWFFAQAVTLATVAGVILGVVGLLMAPWLFRRLGATGDYLRVALAYMNVLLAGGVFFLLPMTFNAALAARGETRVYRDFLVAGFLANCVLNPLLMWGGLGLPPLGVAGIALATVLIQLGGTLWLGWHVAASDLGRGLTWTMFRPESARVRRILSQAVPAILNMMTIALGIFVITSFVQRFGKEAVAAYGIATRIEQAVLMPVIGLSSAVLSVVAQNHGAGLRGRVVETWTTSLRSGVALMLAGGVLVWLLREQALGLFTRDPAVMAKGSGYLSVAAMTLPAYPILFGTVFLMQGLGRPAYGFWIGLYRQAAAPLLVVPWFAFALAWGLGGVWWAICVVNWSAALFACWWGRRELG